MTVLCWALQIFRIVVVARIVLEWIPISFDHPLARARSVLRNLTEPVMAPLRRLIPPVRMGGMGLDLSPIILLIGLSLLMGAVC